MGVDDSNYEMTFYCGVQGSNPEHTAEFKAGVFKVLRRRGFKTCRSEHGGCDFTSN